MVAKRRKGLEQGRWKAPGKFIAILSLPISLLSIHWTLFYPLMFLLIRQTWKQQCTFEIHWEQWRGKLAKPGLGLRGGDEDLSEGRRSQAWLHGDLWQTTDLQCKVCTWIPNHIKKSQNKTPQTLGLILVESLLLQYLWALTWARCAFYSHTGLSATLDPPLSSGEGKSDLPECLSHLSRLHAIPKLWYIENLCSSLHPYREAE